MHLSYSGGSTPVARRGLASHLTPPSHIGSRSPSPKYSGGWKRSNENSMTPPRGAESDGYRQVGGGLSYPGWLYGSSGTGLADPFPSMWLSALFLHVHPKKQVANWAHPLPGVMPDFADAYPISAQHPIASSSAFLLQSWHRLEFPSHTIEASRIRERSCNLASDL